MNERCQVGENEGGCISGEDFKCSPLGQALEGTAYNLFKTRKRKRIRRVEGKIGHFDCVAEGVHPWWLCIWGCWLGRYN